MRTDVILGHRKAGFIKSLFDSLDSSCFSSFLKCLRHIRIISTQLEAWQSLPAWWYRHGHRPFFILTWVSMGVYLVIANLTPHGESLDCLYIIIKYIRVHNLPAHSQRKEDHLWLWDGSTTYYSCGKGQDCPLGSIGMASLMDSTILFQLTFLTLNWRIELWKIWNWFGIASYNRLRWSNCGESCYDDDENPSCDADGITALPLHCVIYFWNGAKNIQD